MCATRVPREKKRDDREYDTTQLRESSHGKSLHRDYSAHFWRWSFAKRMIKRTDRVLEVGCGQDVPLAKILFGGVSNSAESYLGVDINKLKPSNSQRIHLLGETNFVDKHKAILAEHGAFDVVVNLEVIEHMSVDNGKKLLKAMCACLRPGGMLIISTPCYDGLRHAANHIHEYTVPELRSAIEKAGFTVVERFGTFMDVKHIGKGANIGSGATNEEIKRVARALSRYYDNDAISCIFAPLHPDDARNNLWVCRKPAGESR